MPARLLAPLPVTASESGATGHVRRPLLLIPTQTLGDRSDDDGSVTVLGIVLPRTQRGCVRPNPRTNATSMRG